MCRETFSYLLGNLYIIFVYFTNLYLYSDLMKINLNFDKLLFLKKWRIKRTFSKRKFLIYCSIGIIGYIGYRQLYPHKFQFIYSEENPLNTHLFKKLLPVDYRETIYLTGCMLQMLYNETKSAPHIHYQREYISMHDGGCIALDWYQKDPSQNVEKLLVIMHGLTGGSESSYVREIVDGFSKKDEMKIVVINYRGISDSPLLTPRIYHVGFTEDLCHAMHHINRLYPEARCYTLGISMGANIFSKLLSQHNEFNNYIRGFISISNPLNCHEVEKRNRGFIIDYIMLKRQINYIKKHHHMLVTFVGNLSLTQMT
jgi:hypothetical protein